MTDSWTEDEDQLKRDRGIDEPPSRPPDQAGEELRAELLKRLDGYLDRLDREMAKPLIDVDALALLIETGLKVMEMRARVRTLGYPGAW